MYIQRKYTNLHAHAYLHIHVTAIDSPLEGVRQRMYAAILALELHLHVFEELPGLGAPVQVSDAKKIDSMGFLD